MSTTHDAWPGHTEAANATMKLYAALAIDDDVPERHEQILTAFEEIHSHCPGPREWHSALFTATRVAGIMLRTATDNTASSEDFGLAFQHVNGTPHSVDDVPAPIRFVARWITAAINDDIDTCLDLWFGVEVSEDESHEVTDHLVQMLLAFIGGAVRLFLEAGKPLDPTIIIAGHPTPTARRCRQCGCSDNAACVGVFGQPCSWVEKDLCSSCEGVVL